ncbi:MAG: PAS domain S-box protein [Bacteroidetes bacterium]|nr:MAG: PAS domain S-box protein [Bacteroidota bacterium]
MSEAPVPEDFYVAGIGASAGGLEAISVLVSQLPDKLGKLAVVIAQHLSPTYKSRLTELLSRETPLQVIEARNQMPLEPGHIYITPPDRDILIRNRRIMLQRPSSAVRPKPSVDTLLHSLAEDLKSHAIGIILSGTGSDGASGIRHIKSHGGIALVQSPQSARYDGMPRAAIATGLVDKILPPKEMTAALLDLINQIDEDGSEDDEVPHDQDSMARIFGLLSQRTGTDFSNYKAATISRRLEKRMQMLKMPDLNRYVEFIDKHPEEVDALFQNILIGVTEFFRNPGAYEELENRLKELVQVKPPGEGLRIWVPGCATGEEAYTIAIILYRLLQGNFHQTPVQIFGTDIDERAIRIARKGIYPPQSVEKLPDEVRKGFFLKRGQDYEVLKALRSMVLFSKHDLTVNPPFLKLDLISCRNLLIYFGPNLQKHIIPVFHYALNPSGLLLLGKSESIGQFSELFSTVSTPHKLFRRKQVSVLHSIRFSAFKPNKNTPPSTRTPTARRSYTMTEMLKETFFHTYDFPYVIVNSTFDILQIHGDIHPFLRFSSGAMTANILKNCHKDLQIDLRSLLNRALKGDSDLQSGFRQVNEVDATHLVRIIVKPLMYANEDGPLFAIVFEEINPSQIQLHLKEREDTGEDPRVIELEQELAATREHLQSFVEELETSNEELQSLNEELQSANEELQSSNEELETTNEELQSTNEEIQIAYAELKAANEALEWKENQLTESENNLHALLNHTFQGYVLLDKNYTIITFNATARQHYHTLFDRDLQPSISILDFFPEHQVPDVIRTFRQVLNGERVTHDWEYPMANGPTRWIRYNFIPVTDEQNQFAGISLGSMDITTERSTLLRLDLQEKLMASIFNATETGICVTDQNGNFYQVNQGYCNIYGYEKNELIGKHFTLVVPEGNRQAATALHDAFIEGQDEIPGEWEVQRKDGSLIKIYVSAQRVVKQDGTRLKVTTVRDITQEEQNRHYLEMLSMVANQTHGGVIIAKNTGEIIWKNEALPILLPKSQENALLPALLLLNGAAKEQVERVRRAMQEGKALSELLPLPHHQDNRETLLLDISPTTVKEGSTPHAVCILTPLDLKLIMSQTV